MQAEPGEALEYHQHSYIHNAYCWAMSAEDQFQSATNLYHTLSIGPCVLM